MLNRLVIVFKGLFIQASARRRKGNKTYLDPTCTIQSPQPNTGPLPLGTHSDGPVVKSTQQEEPRSSSERQANRDLENRSPPPYRLLERRKEAIQAVTQTLHA